MQVLKLWKIKKNDLTKLGEWVCDYQDEIESQPDSIYKRIVKDFICGQYQFNFLSQKKISQSLRHFDEVGISNELWDCLQDLGDYDFFFISNNNSAPTDVKAIEEKI